MDEARLEDGGVGRIPASQGWFVLNARDARWRSRSGRRSVSFTGANEEEAEGFFPMLGANLLVLEPGAPNSRYHWETEQEAYFVIAGTPLLLVEGEERPLQPWDFVHLPPGTRHVVVGAGDGPSVVLALSSRQFQAEGPWGWYVADEVARRHGAAPPEDTQDADVAYGDLPPTTESRYQDGWLPE